MRCMSVANLIQQAYVQYASGHFMSAPPITLEGASGWITSERYEIDAKVDGAASLDMMRGPMMQTLLEDRLKLKIHHETRGEIPVYALSVAKSGFKLHALEEGGCVAFDITKPDSQPAPGQKAVPPCDDVRVESKTGANGPNLSLIASGLSLETLSNWLPPFTGLDRPLVNKTGINGRFSFRLDFSADATPRGVVPPGGPLPPDASDPMGPSIFTAVQEQLGLKLEPAKVPAEFLVIDHVERPSEN
jgi:uncharacterized protein (TIGR03435 family)